MDYKHIEAWRNRPIEGEHPNVYLDGIVLKRSWAGEIKNDSVLVAIGVGKDTTTINRALGVVRRILNFAASKWRHNYSGLTWLHAAPLITMEKEQAAAKPFTLSWDAQRNLFRQLPDHLASMAL